jgi:hypothetical protein
MSQTLYISPTHFKVFILPCTALDTPTPGRLMCNRMNMHGPLFSLCSGTTKAFMVVSADCGCHNTNILELLRYGLNTFSC